MYQALYRKWRPRTFDEVVGQEHVTEILKKQVLTGRLSHAYLLTGTRGTGKTTCAKLLARAVNCLNPVGGSACGVCDICRGIESGAILDVTEMDAASNNGVDDVRAIRDEAVYAPVAARRRVYIIDEVHMLSRPAFNALLKIMEEPPEHLIFILATTELYKVPATILSRCQRYSFRRVPPELIRQRLLQVAAAEGLELTEEAAGLLSRLADGALRDALSLLDQCAGARVDLERVISAVGIAENEEICRMAEALFDGDTDTALEILDAQYRGGKDVASVLGQLASLFRDLLLGRVAPVNGVSLMSGGFSGDALARLSGRAGARTLLRGLEAVQDTLAGMDRGGDRRMAAELCLLTLAGIGEAAPEAAPVPRAVIEAPAGKPAAPAASKPPAEKPKEAPAEKPAEPPKAEARPAPPPEEAPAPPAAREPEKLSADWLKMPASAPKEAPVEEAPPAAPAEGGEVTWEQVLSRLEKTLSDPDYMLISNGGNLTGKLEGGVLTLYTKNDTMKVLLDESRLEEIRAAARELTGGPVQVRTEPWREDAEHSRKRLDDFEDQFLK